MGADRGGRLRCLRRLLDHDHIWHGDRPRRQLGGADLARRIGRAVGAFRLLPDSAGMSFGKFRTENIAEAILKERLNASQ